MDLKEHAGQKVNEILSNDNNLPVLMLVSGGSSLGILPFLDAGLFGKNITIVPLDERYSREDTVNNMAQIMKTDWYKEAIKKGMQVIDTRVKDGETRSELRKRFEIEIKKWIAQNPTGKIIATAGIGPDGHIAGIKPDILNFKFEIFNDPNVLVADFEGSDFERVTTTFTMLKKLDAIVVYAVGKEEALKRVRANEGSLQETPARILREINNVFWFTDEYGKSY